MPARTRATKKSLVLRLSRDRNELKIDEDFFSNIVTENKEIPESCKDRSCNFHDHSEIYTVQLRMLCQKTDRQSVSVQDSSPVSIVHALQDSKADNWWLRQSPQVLGSAVRGRHPAVQTVTMPLIFTSVKSIWMYWQTVHGKISSK